LEHLSIANFQQCFICKVQKQYIVYIVRAHIFIAKELNDDLVANEFIGKFTYRKTIQFSYFNKLKLFAVIHENISIENNNVLLLLLLICYIYEMFYIYIYIYEI